MDVVSVRVLAVETSSKVCWTYITLFQGLDLKLINLPGPSNRLKMDYRRRKKTLCTQLGVHPPRLP